MRKPVRFGDVQKGDLLKNGDMWRKYHPVVGVDEVESGPVIIVERHLFAGDAGLVIRINQRIWDSQGPWALLRPDGLNGHESMDDIVTE